MTPNLQNMGFTQNHHSTIGGVEPCFLYSNDYLDKATPSWESGSSLPTHPRLWSLRELIELKIKNIAQLISDLQALQFKYLSYEISMKGDSDIDSGEEDIILARIALAKPEINKAEMISSLDRIHIIESRLTDCRQYGISSYTYNEIKIEVVGLLSTILRELDRHKYAYIANTKAHYFDNDKIFGENVYDAFPSIRSEIKDAGNCLSVELYTSAIFHLMRAVEKVLRILARDLKVQIKKTTLEYAEWQTIIKSIGDKVETMASKAHRGPQKSDMLEFYRGALGSFMGFKDAFRNHVSHSRVRYNEHEANSVMHHVDSFMQRLSSRLKETQTKPIAWKI